MKDRIKGLWVKVILASMALPTSLAHATSGTQSNPVNQSLADSMDYAALPGNTGTPYNDFVLGASSPMG